MSEMCLWKCRLVTGSLQLAEGTYLLLDETALSTGQLTSVGIQNIQSLKNLMEWQKVSSMSIFRCGDFISKNSMLWSSGGLAASILTLCHGDINHVAGGV